MFFHNLFLYAYIFSNINNLYLKETDITEAALEKLSKSRIKHVTLVGRRGPLQVAFTIKELREMLHIPKCKPNFDKKDFQVPRDVIKSLIRPRKRLTELLYKSAFDDPTSKQIDLWTSNPEKEWHLKLLRSPQTIHSDTNGQVSSISLGINELIGDTFNENQKVEATDRIETLECGLVLRSIGNFQNNLSVNFLTQLYQKKETV